MHLKSHVPAMTGIRGRQRHKTGVDFYKWINKVCNIGFSIKVDGLIFLIPVICILILFCHINTSLLKSNEYPPFLQIFVLCRLRAVLQFVV
jgi:hypothetical protein